MNARLQQSLDVNTAPVRVRPFEIKDQARWNEFVHSAPEGTFFHLAEWRDVLREAFGHRSYYLLAERDGQICGVLPLALVSSLLFGRALISTPFCVYGGIVAADPDAHQALTDEACALARRLKVDYMELRNRRKQHPEWPCKDLYVTFRKAIDPESEPNMLAIPRKQRAMVRKGIQKGLTSRIDADTADHFSLIRDVRIGVEHDALPDPVIGIVDELLLRLLQLMQEEHQDDGQEQRHEGRVEGDTET